MARPVVTYPRGPSSLAVAAALRLFGVPALACGDGHTDCRTTEPPLLIAVDEGPGRGRRASSDLWAAVLAHPGASLLVARDRSVADLAASVLGDMSGGELARARALERIFHDVFKNTLACLGRDGWPRIAAEAPVWLRSWREVSPRDPCAIQVAIERLVEAAQQASPRPGCDEELVERVDRTHAEIVRAISRWERSP